MVLEVETSVSCLKKYSAKHVNHKTPYFEQANPGSNKAPEIG